jgi:hypothetical protein
MVETYQQWFDGKDHGVKTWAASVSRPYKLDHLYRFQLAGQDRGMMGRVIDANQLELVIDSEDGFVTIIGRASVIEAMEIVGPPG